MIKLKLHLKLTIIFCTAFLFGLLFAYIFLSSNLKTYFEELSINNYKDKLLLINENVKLLIENKAFNDVDTFAKKMGEKLKVRITIISKDGLVIGDSEPVALKDFENHIDRTEIKDAMKYDFGVSKRKSATINKELFYIATKTLIPFGYVRLAVSIDDFLKLDRELRKIIAFTLLLVFVLALIFIVLILYLVSKPLRKMAEVAASMSGGDFSKKPTYNSNDEIGDLSLALTNLSCQIEDKIQKLKHEREKLDAVLSNMFEGIIVVDNKSKIVLMNPSIKKLLYIVSDVDGAYLYEHVNNASIVEVVDKILIENETYVSKEIFINIPRIKVLKVNAVPMLNNEIIEGVVLVFHDITELKNLEKLKQEFVANVSHELRTPVTSIRGYAETILEGAIDDKENLREFLNIIFKDAKRLSSLIEDLLTLSRIESGKLFLELTSCDLRLIINECLSVLQSVIKKKNHKVELIVDEAVPMVMIDAKRIEQVLFNLIDNAIKYTLEGGLITVRVFNIENGVQVDVTDNGIGIPEIDLARIFERFYRVDKARSRDVGGTGLGLAIVKHIVMAHGGEVKVESSFRGSTFSFTILKNK